ncbi:hypothetical protein M569_16825 [Genlisea aurea]|uniref:Uncharacterized protein n=1 Tax=Genlisea aurea TaxID=192259 RepID=S8DF29_9LAMI|nr:hypothetical protein M569_16825 [Genlisea aurea]
MSFESPDKEAYPRHSLSRAALITSGSPIFLLDAFTSLVVFYSSGADSSSLAFPPPHDCLLRSRINKTKQDRIITPKVVYLQGGKDDATPFENYLIEEERDGGGSGSTVGFVSFLDDIGHDVRRRYKSNGG